MKGTLAMVRRSKSATAGGEWRTVLSWVALAVALTMLTAGCTSTATPAAIAPSPTALVAAATAVSGGPTPSPTPVQDHGPAASAEVYGTAIPTPTAEGAAPPTPTPAPVMPTATNSPIPPTATIPAPPPAPSGSVRQRTIALDPGHGGAEVGAANRGIAEKDANLQLAFRLKRILEADGFRVVLTRDSDRRAYTLPEDRADTPRSVTRADLQGRIDIANSARADVFISIHNNGSNDPTMGGTEVWYDPNRPFAHLNKALAEEVLEALVAEIRAAGHPTRDRGIKDDSQFRVFQGQAFPIFVLGPPRTSPTPTRATNMPGVLGETLFVSNPVEAEWLKREDMQEAIARGYRNGLLRYFAKMDAGELGTPYRP